MIDSRVAKTRTLLLLLRLLPVYLTFAALKRAVPVSRLAQWAWSSRPPSGSATIEPVVAAIVRLRNVVGGSGDCLEGSLLLYRELSRAGSSPTLVMGFRQTPGGMAGHSWVELDGQPIAEAIDSLRPFGGRIRFGRGGLVVATDAATPAHRESSPR